MAKITLSVQIKGFQNLDDAARLLGISRATLFRWIRKGKLNKTIMEGSVVIADSEIERLKK